mmetsp:Transcript_14211/g.21675  ORF Transcript_14211/g.21675 Transcript_14211/m.21675 type:complete len:225 (-) Transcript_14211:126-800(-)|eukprot:CAMPEP_0178906786 /NCGR_PEP_ID=MMETSP0786-20121207/7012_1 /TAXON_ID=186022 /ORGANISM="Thalassionema frauenfeldii, Strain CCMP 1798" /LENGTH=224 /DNA_ID=CAMNT_0020578519 /DNA_START=69 /DNA_END=743 /DNA_ORIENTATION=+
MSLELIVKKNNEGLKLVIDGQYRAAEQCLKNALTSLKCIMEQQEYACATLDPCHVHILDNKSTVFSADTSQYIYNNLLEIDVKANHLLHSAERSRSGFSLPAIIIFNLSLAHHLDANKDKSIGRLHQSIMLYKKARKAISPRSNTAVNDQHRQKVNMISLGIMNNIGTIYREFGAYQHAQHCFDYIKNAITKHSNSFTLRSSNSLNEVMMNAWLLEEPQVALAA